LGDAIEDLDAGAGEEGKGPSEADGEEDEEAAARAFPMPEYSLPSGKRHLYFQLHLSAATNHPAGNPFDDGSTFSKAAGSSDHHCSSSPSCCGGGGGHGDREADRGVAEDEACESPRALGDAIEDLDAGAGEEGKGPPEADGEEDEEAAATDPI
jgi:hypothetical protein